MTLTYKKIIRKTWDNQKNIPRCPSKGSFEITHGNSTYFVVDGKLHRTDGPAWIFSDGSQYYYRHGEIHREDGPAIIGSNGTEGYYLFDRYYPKKRWELLSISLALKEQII